MVQKYNQDSTNIDYESQMPFLWNTKPKPIRKKVLQTVYKAPNNKFENSGTYFFFP